MYQSLTLPCGRRASMAVMIMAAAAAARASFAADPAVLAFDEVCRRAKQQALAARLVEEERLLVSDREVPWASPEAGRLAGDLLGLRRETLAHEAARAAAAAFCRVRDLDSRLSVIAELEASLVAMLTRLDAIEAAGGLTGVDRHVVEEQVTATRSQRRAVMVQRESQWRLLAMLIGQEDDGVCGAGPVVPHPLDLQAETARALASRSDLQAAQMMRSSLRRTTLPVARGFLAQVDPALGQRPPPTRPVGRLLHAQPFDTAPRELQVRGRQLDAMLADVRARACAEVAQAVAALAASLDQAALTRATLDAATRRATMLSASAEHPGVTPVRVERAAVDELKARLAHLEAEAHIEAATVELLAARQGL